MTSVNSGATSPYVVDLTSCDREPIQHINAIQPVGFMLAISGDWLVVRVSANVPAFLGMPVAAMLSAPIGKVIRAQAIHAIRNALAVLGGPDGIERCFGIQLQDNGPLYDLAIHRCGKLVIVEAEPNVATGDLNAGAMVRSMLGRMRGQADFFPEAVRLIQALTGFDRVMAYRLHPDGSGEVIAERARSGLEPFLGLRYPASDIPQQARALLVRNKVRILADVSAVPSALLPLVDAAIAPLDLSMSTLRAHSAMHIEYLQNMGVGATMTVSLVCDGKLWGLISCHHRTAYHVGFEQRTTAELFGEILSLQIEKRERAEIVEYEAHTRRLHDDLIAAAGAGTVTDWGVDRLGELVPCDGFAIYADGGVKLHGDTPTAAECLAMRGFLGEQATGRIFATAELGNIHAPARDFVDRAAGMLAIAMPRPSRENPARSDYLVYFRHEQAHSVTWAGRPTKLLVVGPDGPGLSPRKSFAAWREIVRGKSTPWSPAELAAAETMRATLLAIGRQQAGVTEPEIRAAMQKQEMLIAELNHRVRNILGLIRGLVAQSRLSAQDVDTFAAVVGDRIYALARAHDQLIADNWRPGSLAALIATEAGAFAGGQVAQVAFAGPAMLLQPQAFSTFALVIHELMTNAAKHGALANGSGRVAIAWAADAAGDLILDWRESGGPAVTAPVRRGFGSAIIHRSIPHELGGEAAVDYRTEGLHARFVVPARHVLRGDDVPEPATGIGGMTLLDGLAGTVLLVEDNLIIAMEGEDMLRELGASSVLVAGNVADALRLLDGEIPSFALLDINLGIELSWPIATRLREMGVSYVFATGYGNSIDFPLEHRRVPVVAKPYSKEAIARALGDG